MRFVLLLVCVLAVPNTGAQTPVQSPDFPRGDHWVAVYNSETSVVSVHTDSAVRKGDRVAAWFWITFRDVQVSGGTPFDRRLTTWVIDCRERTFWYGIGGLYFHRMKVADLTPDREPRSWVPGSVGEVLSTSACEMF